MLEAPLLQAPVLEAIAGTAVAAALRGSAGLYALVNAAHIGCIGLLLGAIVTLDLRLLGAFRDVPVAVLRGPLLRVAGCGLGGAVLTGLLLFSTRPATYAANPAFLAKLALVGLGLGNALLLRRQAWWRRPAPEVPLPVRAAAVASLLVWPAAILAGRWIGFLQ